MIWLDSGFFSYSFSDNKMSGHKTISFKATKKSNSTCEFIMSDIRSPIIENLFTSIQILFSSHFNMCIE